MKPWLACVFCAACTPEPDPAALRARFGASQIAGLEVPVILLAADHVATTLVPVTKNGPVQVWQSRDFVQISEIDGVVMATRGFGHDLMASTGEDAIAALQTRGGSYTRVWVHLDGRLQLVEQVGHCRLTLQGTKMHAAPAEVVPVWVFVETCGADTPITNTYHIDGNGTVWWSQQWVSAQIGMITLERLAR